MIALHVCNNMTLSLTEAPLKKIIWPLVHFFLNFHWFLSIPGSYLEPTIKLWGWLVSGGKGERWKRKERELKERNALDRCFYWSLQPPHSMIRYHPIKISSGHWVVSCQLHVSKKLAWNKSHLAVWPSSGACVATISLFSLTSNEEFSNTCNGKPAVFEEL